MLEGAVHATQLGGNPVVDVNIEPFTNVGKSIEYHTSKMTYESAQCHASFGSECL